MILASGCFDGLHAGHVYYLTAALRARRGGESLVVAVASDTFIRRFKHREPHWSEADRYLVVKALKGITKAVLHGPEGVGDVVRKYRPRVLVKGGDWTPAPGDEVLRACEDVGTEILRIAAVPVPHTSEALA
jgi:cytidyltransferase-like protein